VLPFADRNANEASVPATLRDVLRVGRYAVAVNGSVGSPGDVTGFVARTAVVSPHDGTAFEYRGEFVLTLTRIDLAAVLPMEAGATFTDAGHRFRVERLHHEEKGLRMFVRTSNVRTIFNRAPRPVYYYFLRNRRLSEAAEANVYRNRVVLDPMFPKASAFQVSTSEVYFAMVTRWPDIAELRLDDAWLKDAELVVVRTVADGMLVRTLTMSGVTLAVD
jgi:hypothetical protein